MWLLFDPNASWQKLAMALYSSTLDGALKQLKALNFLPLQGIGDGIVQYFFMYVSKNMHSVYLSFHYQHYALDITLYNFFHFIIQMRHSLKQIL